MHAIRAFLTIHPYSREPRHVSTTHNNLANTCLVHWNLSITEPQWGRITFPLQAVSCPHKYFQVWQTSLQQFLQKYSSSPDVIKHNLMPLSETSQLSVRCAQCTHTRPFLFQAVTFLLTLPYSCVSLVLVTFTSVFRSNTTLLFDGHNHNQSKQDRQCTYDVTLRRVQETIIAVQKQSVLHIGLCVHACACVRACGYPGAWACACAYVHIALLIQQATRMRNIVTSFVICGPSVYTQFFDIIS